ncbi:uncharacterized protein LOC120252816 isoform X1 [Dioscorea cayenensis subsp. rotundata]|uniref:Uncharacterized protein LOC120252816 isoform X1 n=2 Tax=Dioscorea cayennensis subsp. rotundata TaxID=55577 RepID=A0AB40APH7_DIOCR|nr:uncharacterized protein LOC120252816 isoform X1 [Dioscorea cayenensis subsp. rotundata]
MAANCSHSHLCLLFDSSLLPFIGSKKSYGSITKEAEKELLLSLSKVFREIQKLEEESDSDSDQDSVVSPIFSHRTSLTSEKPSENSHDCLANVVSLSVAFLTFDNQFVQHVAGNILVVISTYLSQFESKSKWLQYLCMLWLSVQAAMPSIFLHTSISEVGSVALTDDFIQTYFLATDELPATLDLDLDIRSFITLSQSRLLGATWVTVGSLFQVLQKILKSLKQDHDDLHELYVHIAVSALLKMPWDLLGGIHARDPVTKEVCSCKDNVLNIKNSCAYSKDIVLGSLFQLMCSLVGQNNSDEIEDGLLKDITIYSKVTNLVPKLLSFCFSEHLRCANNCLSQYLRHKALMLMIRLSFHIHWQRNHALLWIELLKKYFENLTYKSILEYDIGRENCLEGSPFLPGITDGENFDNLCTRHLQRQAIFLLFKCFFTVACINEESAEKCSCSIKALSITCKLQVCCDQCCLLGLSELSEWLQKCVFLGKFKDHDNYSTSCCTFALSFLQLFIEEDDMLFEMLLQLSDAKFISLQNQNNVEHRSFEEKNGNIIFHISRIFDPIGIFHIFLQLLHYDHLIIIDYLISKDIGVHCLQYLLRSLHKICKSWHHFAKYSICESEIDQQYKKRKIFMDNSSNMIDGQNARKQENRGSHEKNRSHTFKNAKECLLSVKRSVEELHQKNLFPYNPMPLIKSFTIFQKLCEEEQ